LNEPTRIATTETRTKKDNQIWINPERSKKKKTTMAPINTATTASMQEKKDRQNIFKFSNSAKSEYLASIFTSPPILRIHKHNNGIIMESIFYSL
jgi:hypothetical protein